MTISLFQRLQVKDFDKWLSPDPGGLAQMMKSQGVLAYSLYRNADDPNGVLLQLQFSDRDTLNSFRKWYEPMAAEWQKMNPGGEQKIVENWVGEGIPSFSRTL
jgi:quinol monooxygenase YgiN